jgi:tRNA (guanine37-N1)-methyltransferase
LERLYKSYDIVGDVAVIRVPEPLQQYAGVVAKAVMNVHSEVKTVLRQTNSVSGEFRLRDLEHVLGDDTTQTVYREYGCRYKTDIKKTYFSPRLSYERLRIAKLVQPNEAVVNMFAGVGCYSVCIAKHSRPSKVYSIDVNPDAFRYQQENVRLNRAEKVVVPMLGDSKTAIETQLRNTADRVLMPLPEKALDYIDCAVLALKPSGGWVHYYGFEHANKGEDPVRKTEAAVSEKLYAQGVTFEVNFGRVVRTIGPNWYQTVLDFHVQK